MKPDRISLSRKEMIYFPKFWSMTIARIAKTDWCGGIASRSMAIEAPAPDSFLSHPPSILAGAARSHRVAGRFARSARQTLRDGVTGGIGLGYAVVGSRDPVRIVARSRVKGD